MVKISTSIAIEAGKEYTCIKDGVFGGKNFVRGRVYESEVSGKLKTHVGGMQVSVDEDYFELYEPVHHLCIKEVSDKGRVAFIKGKKYGEIKHRNIRAETGTIWRIGEGFFYRDHFKEIQDEDITIGAPKETKGEYMLRIKQAREIQKEQEPVLKVEGEISNYPKGFPDQIPVVAGYQNGMISWDGLPSGKNSFDKDEPFNNLPEPGQVFNPQQHYDNTNGSLYKIAGDFGLNAYEFDILKRLTRCRKKGQFAEDLQKIKDTVDLYLLEQGGKHVQLHNGDTAGGDSTNKEQVSKQG